MSPIAFMMNAFLAAATAVGRSHQKPISRYDERPTRPQPASRMMKSPASTSTSIENTKRFRYAKKRRSSRSPCMYPIEYAWIRKPTPVTTSSMITESGSTRIETCDWNCPAETQCQPVETSTRWSGLRRSSETSATQEAMKPPRMAPEAMTPTVRRETDEPMAVVNASPARGAASAIQAA